MNTKIILTVLTLTLLASQPLMARTPVAAPEPDAPEGAIYQPDRDLPLNPQGRWTVPRQDTLPPRSDRNSAPRSGEVGGDDVPVADYNHAYHGIDLAVDSQGIFYSIGMVAEEDQNIGFDIRRSTDEGETWSQWATFEDPDPDHDYAGPSLHIAEGNSDQIFIAYSFRESGSNFIQVASSPLGDTASFTITTIDETSGFFGTPSITSDASAYSGYFLYLSYGVQVGNATEIRFARSADLGASWETPYSIASLDMPDRGYFGPRVSYGYGHYVHVAWSFTLESDIYDGALRYRRVPNYGSGGQGSWDSIRGITDLVDGYFEYASSIAASGSTGQILVGYERKPVDGWYENSGVVASQNQGVDWDDPHVLDVGLFYLKDVAQDPDALTWYVSGTYYGEAGYSWAPSTNLTDWSPHLALSDQANTYSPQLALDPNHDFRPAMLWDLALYDPNIYRYMFDAEWRGDEGYPNHEDGFPVDLSARPISDPALYDLDNDGDLEIVFGDTDGFVQVYRSDGTIQPGWPVYIGTSLSDSPVAIADMNGDGDPVILAPSADGRVFGYNADGSTAYGWPFDSEENAYASVNIGNLGPPYRYTAVVIAGSRMFFLGPRGQQVPGSYVWNNTGFLRGVAIGDYDNDGVNEVVFRAGQLLLATEMNMSSTDLYRNIGSSMSSLPALGDLDLDGNVEIVITTPGTVHVIDDSGADFPGWPQTFDPGVHLSAPAIATIFGTFEPEVAVCSRNWKAALYQHNGTLVGDYPVETDEHWYIYGNPILGTAAGSPDVIFGARGSMGYAYSNFGDLTPGWPKHFNNQCELTPAMGDIDQDNRNEIVFLTRDQLVVVDVGAQPWAAIHTWLMTGHDARRTGCADCPEDLLTPVPDDPEAVTRVSFAAPNPNPVRGSATFSYAVPVQAVVELAVYDLRGHRVALVNREEVIPGRHDITWNGRDDQGRHLASGNYVAALRVRGPGLNEQLNRKVTILR